ncbi:MAG: hypothetical protein WBI17_02735 [Clostridiaceae bacterium]
MKNKVILNLLGGYDLLMSLGAFYIGANMILEKGVFNEYPKEWLSKVPFQNWLLPAIIGIVVFGLGNSIAAIFSFRKKDNLSWIVSAIMAGTFFLSMVAQYVIFREWYLPSSMLLIFSIIQIVICGLAVTITQNKSLRNLE